MKKVFKREYLIEELDLPYSNIISEKMVDRHRWTIDYEIIFEDNGKYYRTYYQTGATESQEVDYFYDEDEIECEEVEKRFVQIEAWLPVDETKNITNKDLELVRLINNVIGITMNHGGDYGGVYCSCYEEQKEAVSQLASYLNLDIYVPELTDWEHSIYWDTAYLKLKED